MEAAASVVAQGADEAQPVRGMSPTAVPAIDADTSPAIEGASGSLVGRGVGAYRIVRELVRGDIGADYLAERADDQFRRQVRDQACEYWAG